MKRINKLIHHFKNGTLIERIRYQFSGIRKWDNMNSKKQEFCFHNLEKGVKIKLYRDSYLSYLILRGKFETEEIFFLKKVLSKEFVFFDVGSNIGLFSLIASKYCKKVYAFEPTPQTYSRLIENIALNHFDNITPNNIALSNNDGSAVLIQDEVASHDAWNRLSNEVVQDNSAKTVLVKTMTLDAFIHNNNIEQNNKLFLKIDVEGWEKYVLEGAEALLKRNNIIFLIEFNDENFIRNGYSGRDLINFLEKFEYTFYEFTNGGLKKHQINQQYEYCNLVAAKVKDNLLTSVLNEQ